MTNCGRGIQVYQSLQSIISAIKNDKVSTNDERQRTWIVQLYLDNPLLYCKRKFDIRCYGMFTSLNGIQKGYFYNDGYIRTSSKEYNTNNEIL